MPTPPSPATAGRLRSKPGPVRGRLVWFLWCAMAGGAVAADGAKPLAKPSPMENAAHIKSFVSAYCLGCHEGAKAKKHVRLDALDYTLADVGAANTWQDVLDVLNLGQMPPEDEKQPKVDESIQVLSSLTDALKSARTRLAANGGRIALRHLNAREYGGTLEDVFGMKVPRDRLPEDANSERFDTIGAGQYFTPHDLERYFTLGREFVLDAMECLQGRATTPSTVRTEPVGEWTKRAQEELDKMRAKMAKVKASKDWREAGFDAESSYATFIKYYDEEERKQKRILEDPHWKSGIIVGTAPANEVYPGRWMPAGAYYKFRLHGGIVGEPPGERTLLRISAGNATFATLSFNARWDAPETVELEFESSLLGADRKGTIIHTNEIRSGKQWRIYKDAHGGQFDSPVWIDWWEFDGPYYRAPSPFETCIKPLLDRKDPAEGEVRAALATFAYHCFRRSEPQKEYLDGLVALYLSRRRSGADIREALAEPLALVLSSPAFLYVLEAGGGQPQALDQRELAIRLAYFLWSAPPDGELYRQAEQGALASEAGLRAAVERLLAAPQAQRFMAGFIDQWAELKRFDGIAVHDDFYQFMEVTRASARREPVEFFNTLVQENLPLADLIDSDFVVIDKALAVFYGIPGTFDHHFRKTALPPGGPRGGLLGQAFFSVMNGTGSRTSPVTRGVFVMKRFLDREPARPPPDVPALVVSADHPLAVRDITLAHVSRPQCASCHAKFDPIGFGLEHFDPVGLWRDTETVGTQERPIDARGGLPDGSRFSDLGGLKKALRANEDHLARGLYEALSSYALGRRMEFTDREATDAALKELKTSQYRLKDMIMSIVLAKSFRTK